MSDFDQNKYEKNSGTFSESHSYQQQNSTIVLQTIEKWIESIGNGVAWLTLLMCLLTTLVVILRTFSIGTVAIQESVLYFHGAVFLLGAALTLKKDAHVRVDVFYRNLTEKKRAWIDLIGTLFLLFPTVIFIFWSCWEYVVASWRILETSRESSGLPFVYLQKSLMLGLPLLLFLQGVALVLKNVHKIKFSSHSTPSK